MPPKNPQAAKAVNKKKAAADTKSSETKPEPEAEKDTEMAEDEAPAQKDDEQSEVKGKDDSKPETNGKSEAQPNTSKKRKSPSDPPSTKEKLPAKAPRQGTRVSSRSKPSTSTSPSPRQLLNFLLSSAALPYCYPDDDIEADQKKKYSTTSPAAFTPFEHLLTASLLSKPLSHKLGMRSTRTLLNEPYSFSTPGAIVKAGEKRVWQSLEDARTQHRQKTASYIYDMGQAFEDGEAMSFLKEMVNDKGPQGVINEIGKTIKGMGQTGAEIFCRRIQAVDGWGEALWPFADGRSLDALRNLGVEVKDADELQEMVETLVDWAKVGTMGLDKAEGMEMEQQIQLEYVVLLERAVGASLEGNIDEVKKAALEAN